MDELTLTCDALLWRRRRGARQRRLLQKLCTFRRGNQSSLRQILVIAGLARELTPQIQPIFAPGFHPLLGIGDICTKNRQSSRSPHPVLDREVPFLSKEVGHQHSKLTQWRQWESHAFFGRDGVVTGRNRHRERH
jgi:hypothetical protein